MTAADFHDQARPPRWWILTLCLAVTVQTALIFWLSDYQESRPRRRSHQTHLHLVPGLSSPQSRSRPEPAVDPTLFALVTAEGFSRNAWLTVPTFAYGLTNVPEPIRWLNIAADDLASDFAEFVQTNLLAEDVVANELPATLARPTLPTAALVAGTEIAVQGALSNRRWQSPLPLPQLPEPVLTNSTVRVLADGNGRTLSAALLGSSGVPAADQAALTFSRSVRFAPPSSPTLGQADKPAAESGVFVFRWAQTRWTNQVEAAATTASVTP